MVSFAFTETLRDLPNLVFAVTNGVVTDRSLLTTKNRVGSYLKTFAVFVFVQVSNQVP